jgi:hypothetical protein
MEISDLYTVEAHEAGSEMRVLSPSNGDDTNFYIRLMGPDSKQYREAVRTFQMQLLEKVKGADIDLLVAVTKGWRGLKDKKKDVVFSPEAAKDLYTNAPFIASQIDRYIADRRNFTPG